MIEENITALVSFKAKHDIKNGTTFLICVDPTFSSLFKNGTVVSGLLKQRSKSTEKFIEFSSLDIPSKFDKPNENVCFSKALTAIKNNFKVCRQGWNGKGMHVALLNPWWPNLNMVPYMILKTVDGSVIPWTPSQADALAEDWIILPK